MSIAYYPNTRNSYSGSSASIEEGNPPPSPAKKGAAVLLLGGWGVLFTALVVGTAFVIYTGSKDK